MRYGEILSGQPVALLLKKNMFFINAIKISEKNLIFKCNIISMETATLKTCIFLAKKTFAHKIIQVINKWNVKWNLKEHMMNNFVWQFRYQYWIHNCIYFILKKSNNILIGMLFGGRFQKPFFFIWFLNFDFEIEGLIDQFSLNWELKRSHIQDAEEFFCCWNNSFILINWITVSKSQVVQPIYL